MNLILERVAVALALVGGAVVAAVITVAFVSIAGRALFASPIVGDFEVVEQATALSVALFLPYCQVRRGHLTVDFLTAWAPAWVRHGLDQIARVVLALVVAVLAWRTGVNAVQLAASGEVSMLLRWPSWILPSLVAPCLAFFAVVLVAHRDGSTAAQETRE